MLISEAFAQAASSAAPATGVAGGLGQLQQFLPLVLIVVVFYFLLLRPQSQKAKRHRELVANLRRGDRVVTSSGIFAQVSKVIDETKVQVEIAEGIKVQMLRSAVSEVLAKTEPVTGSATPANDTSSGDGTAAPAKAPEGLAGLLGKLFGKR
jgi:preprotein translocase subunit YajC